MSNAANEIIGEIKEHVFGKRVRRTHSQGPGCRWSAPLVEGRIIKIVLSQVGAKERLAIMKTPGPEIPPQND